MLTQREKRLWWLTRLYPRLRFALPGDRAAPFALLSWVSRAARTGVSIRRCSGGAGLVVCACVPRPRPARPLGGGWVGRGLSGRAGWSRALACLPGGGAGWL